MNYRKATTDDIPSLCNIRKKQLIDEGIELRISIDEELNDFFSAGISDGSLIEWTAEDDGRIVATAAIMFVQFPPTYTNRSGVSANCGSALRKWAGLFMKKPGLQK